MVSDIAAPSLKGLDTISAKAGDRSFSTMYGISAIDDHDGDITRNVTVSGNFDISAPGDYRLTYTVKDNAGNEVTGDRTIHVTKNEIVTVSYDANGGSGSVAPQTFGIGEYQSLRSYNLVRTHYNFTCWNTKADGTGKNYYTWNKAIFDDSDVPANGK